MAVTSAAPKLDDIIFLRLDTITIPTLEVVSSPGSPLEDILDSDSPSLDVEALGAPSQITLVEVTAVPENSPEIILYPPGEHITPISLFIPSRQKVMTSAHPLLGGSPDASQPDVNDFRVSQEMSFKDNPPSYQAQRAYTPNVLVVGEIGVGKSSVINLIAGEKLAEVSASASGCTMEASSYDIVLPGRNGLSGRHIRLFDTIGLNEPSLSKNEYLTVIEKANMLITQLLRTGGIRLLIFCIRGGRITSVTQSNYYLFCNILCQGQVPVAFVITGMENEQPMEAWWTRNATLFERANLLCTSHVCVTATSGLNNIYARQYQASQRAIRNMLLDHMSGISWKPERRGLFVHLAGRLLKWVGKVKNRKGHLQVRSKDLTEEELARHLKERCYFTPEEAVELARRIWSKRKELSGPGFVEEDA